MVQSRRGFLARATAATALSGTVLSGAAFGRTPSPHPSSYKKLAGDVLALFEPLPGIKALRVWAPEAKSGREFDVSLNAQLPLFCGSSFKAFVLCQGLRQIDGPGVSRTLRTTMLDLDETVWSLSSTVFNPPRLSGVVSYLTALEAMISHSDNTATDMAINHVGVETIRDFIASIGLHGTRIPNSTRQYFAYIFGVRSWETATWDQLVAAAGSDAPLAHPVVNAVQTMVSTPDDFVSFYSRALQGEFFQHPQTLTEFRNVLRIADILPVVVPLGATGFGKGGSIDAGGSHALCIAGGCSSRSVGSISPR
jgi:beta-lactamase class A